jgi:hypothetical protein
MVRLIEARTTYGGRPWPPKISVGIRDDFDKMQEQLRDSANRILDLCEDFHDVNNFEVEHTKHDYERWATVLKARYGWCDGTWKNGIAVNLFFLLSTIHRAWQTHMQEVNKDVPFDLNPPKVDTVADAIEAANSQIRVRKPVCDEDEKPNHETDQETDRPLGIVRTDKMVVKTDNNPHLDAEKVDQFHAAITQLREVLDKIDTGVSELVREQTLTNTELSEVVQSLEDAARDMNGLNLVAESYTRKASS